MTASNSQVGIFRVRLRPKLSPEQYVRARLASRRVSVSNHPDEPELTFTRPAPTKVPGKSSPGGARGGFRWCKFDHFYPFEVMLVGQSFWVPSQRGCTHGAVTKFARASGWKFVCSSEGEDGTRNRQLPVEVKGVRVWRIG